MANNASIKCQQNPSPVFFQPMVNMDMATNVTSLIQLLRKIFHWKRNMKKLHFSATERVASNINGDFSSNRWNTYAMPQSWNFSKFSSQSHFKMEKSFPHMPTCNFQQNNIYIIYIHTHYTIFLICKFYTSHKTDNHNK